MEVCELVLVGFEFDVFGGLCDECVEVEFV